MDKSDVDRWLDRYVEAWESADRDRIADLFSEDAEYRYRPFDEPLRGRGAIVESWLEHDDPPGSFEAQYRALAVDGDVAVAAGTSSYPHEGRVYDNVFVLRFDGEGRCRSFTEWFIQRPGGS